MTGRHRENGEGLVGSSSPTPGATAAKRLDDDVCTVYRITLSSIALLLQVLPQKPETMSRRPKPKIHATIVRERTPESEISKLKTK
jgi:hypothetical protein